MKTTSMRDFRSRIAELIDGDEPVLVTRRGKNAAVLFPLKDPNMIPIELRRKLFRELTNDIARQLDAKRITDGVSSLPSPTLRSVVANSNVLPAAGRSSRRTAFARPIGLDRLRIHQRVLLDRESDLRKE